MNGKLDRICKTLRANGVPFDEAFAELDARGYASDACQALSERIVEDIEQLVIRAVNTGFGAKENGAVGELIRLALKLGERKAAQKLVKYTEQRERILAGVPQEEKKEEKMDIREETRKFIDVTRKGTKAVMRLNIGDRLAELFGESCELLDKIEQAVNAAWDDSTKNAADLAGQVTDGIVAYQKKLAYYTCDEDAVESLRQALARAEEWSRLNEAPQRKKDIADEKYIDAKVGFTDPYGIGTIHEGLKYVDKIQIFRDTLRRFEEDTEKLCGTKQLEKERAKLRARQEQIDGELNELVVKYANGEMSAEESDEQSVDLEEERADLDAELSDLRGEIEDRNSLRRLREKSSKEFGRLSNKILAYENDPAMLSMLAENIDFAELCGALLGRMSSAEMKGVVNNILSVFDMVKVHGGFTKEVRDAWRGIREELHMEREEQRKQRESRIPEQRKEGNSEAERRMQERLARLQKAQGAAQEREEEQRARQTVIPLSDGDK